MSQDGRSKGFQKFAWDDKQNSSECHTSLEDRLFLAVYRGDSRTVRVLLDKGANVSAVCSSGRTVLGTAAHVGNLEILRMLLEAEGGVLSSHSNPVPLRVENRRTSGAGADKQEDTKNITKKSSVPSTVTINKQFKWSTKGCDGGILSDNDESDIKLGKSCKSTDKSERQLSSELTDGDSAVIRTPFEGFHALEEFCRTDVGVSPDVVTDDTISTLTNGSNQGYFIMVHDECLTEHNSRMEELEKCSLDENLNEPKTPDGMDNLEWDTELQQEEDKLLLDDMDEKEPDPWVKLYRWYADYLARSSVVEKSSVACDVNEVDVYGRHALHYAAEQGHMDVIRFLIQAGCHVDVGDSEDVTPLHLAAARNHPKAVSLLVSAGARVNRMSMDRMGPLHMAAARGFTQTARILLEYGANVNAVDRSDRTPLMLAVARGLEEMVALLIHHGAKVNVEEIHGYTPLCQAVWQQQEELVRVLLAAGAKLTQSDHLLHYAILHRRADIAKLLLTAGSIVNLRDDNGDTPLIIAARSGQVDIVELLLESGAIPNYPNGLTGSTPLHEAVESLRPAQYAVFRKILCILLKYGAYLNLESSASLDTPLTRAFVHDKDRAMIILIQHGADVNVLQEHTPIVDTKYLNARPDRWIIAQLMVYAGLDLWKLTPEVKFGDSFPPDSPGSWIVQMKFNPMSLAGITRLNLRRHFAEHVYRSSELELPTRLKHYIMLEDIVYIEES